jgi:hypothetical protein
MFKNKHNGMTTLKFIANDMCFSEISLGPYYLGSPSEIIIQCQEMIPTRNTIDAHM